MLIRPSGRHDGVKQYLEDGQKIGRSLSRDELDERVVLAGDLDLTDAVIQSIDAPPRVSRYLSITLSFKEDHIDRQTLLQIARDFESFAMHAYRSDEYCFYAEAHLPRVKSYIDQSSGELVERKPHIHIVIPKTNLISGQSLRPLGFEKYNIQYIDAFQEHTNAQYGLASPKDNRRTVLSDASEMISRYRGDLFRANGRALKEQILDAMLDRNIVNYDDFMGLLAEHGAVRMRNAGHEDAYPNVKPHDAPKGTNLKEYVFTPAFIALPTQEKLRALSADAADRYEVGAAPRDTPQAATAILDEWYATRSREVKYLNSGSRQYQRYQESSPYDRALMLAELERGFYAQHVKAYHDGSDDTFWTVGWRGARADDGFALDAEPFDPADGRGEREFGVAGPGWHDGWERREEPEWQDQPARSADGYLGLDAQFDVVAGGPQPSAEPFDLMRNLPGSALDRLGDRSSVLLSRDAVHELEPEFAVPEDSVRWGADRAGEFAAQRVAPHSPDALQAYHRALEARYAFGDPFVDLPAMPAADMPAAVPFPDHEQTAYLDHFEAREAAFDFGAWWPAAPPDDQHNPASDADGSRPSWVGDNTRPEALQAYHRALEARYAFGDPFVDLPAMPPADMPPSVPFPDHQETGYLDHFEAREAAFDFGAWRAPAPPDDQGLPESTPYGSRRSREGDDAFLQHRRTGRVSDNVVSQLTYDIRERNRIRAQNSEFTEIRRTLSAQRVLAELSYSHGVRPAKYTVVMGRDGSERIRAGRRALNVSDFLTKELNLSWTDAAPMLRAMYARQQAGEPIPAVRELPRAALWRQYAHSREAHVTARREAWLTQRTDEQQRRAVVRGQFDAQRLAIKQDPSLTPAARRAAQSLARADYLARNDALGEAIAQERAALKERFPSAQGPSFAQFLRTRADQGDEQALGELRRTTPVVQPEADAAFNVIRADQGHPPEYNAIIFRAPDLTWSVDERGHVTYCKDGLDVVRDRGADVQVLQVNRGAIEAGLRLAQSKFGHTLALCGNEAYQLAAAQVAVEAGLRVRFSDTRLNQAMDQHRSARIERHVQDVLGTPGQSGQRTVQQSHDRPMPFDDTKPAL
ncbi:LPD7 domain-containing protein [Robbsia andropogonis]|uniref:LPD7 domain-containing protein n=1 Tax=Robbsia andropogonis TaxID=28092 RepID=UPI002A69AC3C|nr:LPD7 domain-containing protein [Robbsia andropogonis]